MSNKRISLNACGLPVFSLTYGSGWFYNKKWTFQSTTAILLLAVEAGFAKVEIIDGTYGRTHIFTTNDGQLIRKQYTDYTNGFDTWNPFSLPKGIYDLSQDGVYHTIIDDIDAIALMHLLPSLY